MKTTNGAKVIACVRAIYEDKEFMSANEDEIAYEMAQTEATAKRFDISTVSAALLRLGALGKGYGESIGVKTYITEDNGGSHVH